MGPESLVEEEVGPKERLIGRGRDPSSQHSQGSARGPSLICFYDGLLSCSHGVAEHLELEAGLCVIFSADKW